MSCLEPRVAQAARGFFDGFAMYFGFGGRVDACVVEGDVELLGKRSGELEVGVGLIAAQAVVQVGGMEDEAKFPALFAISFREGTQERDGVGSAGEPDGKAQAGTEQRRVERERGRHERMIREQGTEGTREQDPLAHTEMDVRMT